MHFKPTTMIKEISKLYSENLEDNRRKTSSHYIWIRFYKNNKGMNPLHFLACVSTSHIDENLQMLDELVKN